MIIEQPVPSAYIWFCEANEGNSNYDSGGAHSSNCYGGGEDVKGRSEPWKWTEAEIQMFKELALGTGCAAAGDYPGAAEHGAKAFGHYLDNVLDFWKN
jgi:hypothetical protein